MKNIDKWHKKCYYYWHVTCHNLQLLSDHVKHVQIQSKSIELGGGMRTGSFDLNELVGLRRRVRVRLKLKSCPRCKGDVVVELDQFGWYEECIQCGYLHDLQNVVEVKQQAAQRGHNTRY